MQKTEIVLATLILYKLVLISIGWWASKRTKSSDDFFLGGRGLGPVVAALSYSSSAASAWVLLGLTGIAYQFGISTIWVALGSITSMFVVWFWLAPRLMRFSRDHDYITLTEVIAHQSKGGARKAIIYLSTFIIVASFTLYVAAQFQGAGNTFASTFDLSMTSSITLGAFIIMIYTLLGGFWAVSVTDAVQGSLMAIAAIFMPIAAYIGVGGFSGLLEGLAEHGDASHLSLTASNGLLFALGIIVGGLSIGFGTYGQPHLMARIMALRDANAMRRARTITVVWYLIVFLGMWFVGLSGHVLHAGLSNPEQIFFVMLDGLFPTVVSAIFLAAVLSAIMSTADSQLLSAAAAIANDLGLGRDKPERLLLVSRLSIVLLVLASVVVALYLPQAIFSRVLFAWMALGAAFGPALFFRLARIEVSSIGLVIAIAVGFGLTILLSLAENAPGDVVERLLPFVAGTLVLLSNRKKTESSA